MVTPGVRIRAATADDATELADLGIRTFIEAYGDTNNPVDLADHIAETFTEHAVAIAVQDTRVTYLVAESAGQAVGFAKLVVGSGSPQVDATSPAELQQLYVLRRWHGDGLGTALLEECVQRSRQLGCDVLWLGVWEANQRAIGFYERRGFRSVGVHTFQLGSQPQTDLVMMLRLTTG